MKNRLWVGILVAVLMLAMTGLAVAAETPMVLGQEVTSDGSLRYQQMLYFSYTPEESGYYLFELTNADDFGGVQGILLDDEGNTLSYDELFSDKGLLYPLNAGNHYHFWIRGMQRATVKVSRYTDRIWVPREQEYLSASNGDDITLTATAMSTTGNRLSYSWFRTDGGERVQLPGVRASYRVPAVTAEGEYICSITDGTATKEISWDIELSDDTFSAFSAGESEIKPASNTEHITMTVDAKCTMGFLSYQWYTFKYIRTGETGYEERNLIAGETGASLSIDGPYEELQTYICEVSGIRNEQVFAQEEVWFEVDAYTDFEISAVNSNLNLLPGESVTLEVALTGNTKDVDLSWGYYDNDGFVTIEGANGTSLTVSEVQSSYTYYECTASRGESYAQTSFSVRFIDGMNVRNNGDYYVEKNDLEPVTLSISATTDAGELTYQWYEIKNDPISGYEIYLPLEGCNTATFTEPSVINGVGRRYCCLTTNGYSAYTHGITVWHSAPDSDTPPFLAYPDGQSSFLVNRGGSAEMRTGVENAQGPVRYRWLQQQGQSLIPVDGAVQSSYTATDIQETTDYYCQATDSETASTSSASFHINIATPTDLQAAATTAQEQTVEPETQVQLSVSVTGGEEPLHYEWYERKYDPRSEAWVTSMATGAAGGAYTPTIDRESVFTCVVSDDFGYQQVDFTVHMDSGLTAEAAADTDFDVSLHDSISLEVIASSSQNRTISYEWIRTGNEYDGYAESTVAGAVGPICTIDDVDASCTYTCWVSDGFTIIPIRFSLYVDNAFSIEREGDYWRSVRVGQPETLKVNVFATDKSRISYKWVPYSFSFTRILSTTDTLVTDPVTQSIPYYVQVTDGISGETRTISFYIVPDSGLTVEAVGETDISLAPGESATLKVNATHDTTDAIWYTWYHYEYNLETGEQERIEDLNGLSDTVTITDPITEWYYCKASDTYMSEEAEFYIRVDSGFEAETVGGSDILAELGETMELEVWATHDTNDEIRYQWYWQTYNAEWDFWEDHVIEGATGNSLTITASEKKNYYCRVSDRYTATNVWFYVKVNSHLKVSFDQINPVRVHPNESATLSVSAQSDYPDQFTYRWSCNRYNPEYGYFEWVDIGENVQGSELTIADANTNYEVYVTVSDGYMDTSCSIYVQIDSGLTAEPDGPGIFPIDQGPVTMAVRAENLTSEDDDILYQWYDQTGNELSGATESTYTVENPTAGYYRCHVSDAFNETDVRFYLVEAAYATAFGDSYQYVSPNEQVTVRVMAWNPEGDISYQWYLEDNTMLEGETGDTYSLTAEKTMWLYCRVTGTGIDQNVQFHIQIQNEFSATDPEARFYVIPANGGVELKAEVTSKLDKQLTFVWEKDGAKITGENGNTLTVEESGRYWVSVRDQYDNTWSGFEYICTSTEPVSFTAGQEIRDAGIYQITPEISGFYQIDTNASASIYQEDSYSFSESFYAGADPVFFSAGKTYYLMLQDGEYFRCFLGSTAEHTITLRPGQRIEIPPMRRNGGYYYKTDVSSSSPSIVRADWAIEARRTGTADVTVYYEIGNQLYHVTVVSGDVLTMPTDLQAIEEDAFNGNTAIRAVELGGNVSTVKSGAFANIGNVNVVVEGYYTTFEDGVFAGSNPTVICTNGSEAAAYCERKGIPYFYPN